MDEKLLYKGSASEISLYCDIEMQKDEVFGTLNEKEETKIMALVKKSADNFAILTNVTKFKHLEGQLYEYKSRQSRIAAYVEANAIRKGMKILLLFCFTKKKGKTPLPVLEKARRIIKEINEQKRLK